MKRYCVYLSHPYHARDRRVCHRGNKRNAERIADRLNRIIIERYTHRSAIIAYVTREEV